MRLRTFIVILFLAGGIAVVDYQGWTRTFGQVIGADEWGLLHYSSC